MLRKSSSARLRINSNFSLYFNSLRGLLEKKYFSQEPVVALEEKIRGYVGSKFAIVTPTARIAIYLTLKYAVDRKKTEVVLSPYTISEVVNMVILAGKKPIFADIDELSCNISPATVEAKINKKTGAVLVTHFYGLMAPMKQINEICNKYKVTLIEDAAQAFGAETSGVKAGRHGDFGIYSFGLYKFINGFYGGAIVTDDRDTAEKIRNELDSWAVIPKFQLAKKIINGVLIDAVTHPIFFKSIFFWFFRFCFMNKIDAVNNKLKIDVNPQLKTAMPFDYKVRMSGLQASLILAQFGQELEQQIEIRIEHAKLYHHMLKNIKGIQVPKVFNDRSHVYWYFPIIVDDRNELVKYSLKNGRDITKSYHRNCASMECFSNWYAECQQAEKVANSVIYLPTYPRYGSVEVRKTAEVIKKYFEIKKL